MDNTLSRFRHGLIVIFSMLLCILSPASIAADSPRIGVVLGGGGARGFAHIGVLRELERLRIPIACIAGTSAGALVGGFYSSGMTLDHMSDVFAHTDWDSILSGRPARADVPYERKRDDYLNYFNAKLGWRDGAFQFPRAAVKSQQIDLFIRKLTHDIQIDNFNKLPIPFQAVATNLVTGESVVFDRGDLAFAQRASMAVPGLFDPVEYQNTLLVDGGMSRQLPIENLKNQCADVLIVVNVGTLPLQRDQINTVFDVLAQSTNIGVQQNVRQQMALLDSRDVIITPNLEPYTAAQFDQSPALVQRGEEAAQAIAGQLKKFSVSESEYQAWRLRFTQQKIETQPIIDVVRVGPTRIVNHDALVSQLHVETGKPFDQATLTTALDRLYATGDYERLGYAIVEENGQHILNINPIERVVAPNTFSLGYTMEGDTGGTTGFDLLLGYRRTWINRLGAEIRMNADMGQSPALGAEFYQPLSLEGNTFVALSANMKTIPLTLYDESGRKLSEYSLQNRLLNFEVGESLGHYGEIRIGVVNGTRSALLDVGDHNTFQSNTLRISGVTASAVIDQFDYPKLPRSGYLAQINGMQSLTAMGASTAFSSYNSRFDYVDSYGRNTLRTTLKWSSTYQQEGNANSQSTLGGFLNLSGYQQNQLLAQQTALLRVMGYRQIANIQGLASDLLTARKPRPMDVVIA